MNKTNNTIKEKLSNAVPSYIILLFALQPIIDALRFWQEQLAISNIFTIATRVILLVLTALIGLLLTDNKKLYFIFYGVSIALVIAHIFACIKAGNVSSFLGKSSISSIIEDLENQLRIYHLPIFAISFITMLKTNKNGINAVEKGFFISFAINAIIIAISVISRTDPYTYPEKQLGFRGWSIWANGQSAILCMIIPIALYFAWNKNKRLLFPITLLSSTAILFFFGTRLSFLGLFASAAGFLVVLLLTKQCSRKEFLLIVFCIVVCVSCFKLSPMYQVQSMHLDILSEKTEKFDELIAEGIQQYGEDNPKSLESAYREFYPSLIDRFGIEKVAKEFNYTKNAEEYINNRTIKIVYGKLLQDELPLSSKLFGIEIRAFKTDEMTYDVENDFYGILYLCGWVGLLILIAFIGYFVYLIVNALLRDAKKYFTVESGSVGIAFIMGLLHAIFTASVLRLQNASFYLSVILAMIYYLVIVKVYKTDEVTYSSHPAAQEAAPQEKLN